MSAGGQRGIDISGITATRIQNASDVTFRLNSRLIYQNFASTTGANAYVNETPNAWGSYLQFLQGRKEGCATCTGLPFQWNISRSFRT